MLRPLIALALLLSLSCSDKEPPVAPSAFDEQVEPWQTIEINDVPYRRLAAKSRRLLRRPLTKANATRRGQGQRDSSIIGLAHLHSDPLYRRPD